MQHASHVESNRRASGQWKDARLCLKWSLLWRVLATGKPVSVRWRVSGFEREGSPFAGVPCFQSATGPSRRAKVESL
eukprot:26522_4